MASGTRIYTGSYIGTGAALTIDSIPFQAAYIRCFETDDYATGTAVNQEWVKADNMPTDMFFDITGALIIHAGQGVTITGDGFNLGTAAEVNTNAKRYLFVAMG
jgi:hypothetical protein